MRVFYEPPKMPYTNDPIFTMTPDEIIEKENIYPEHEGQHPIFSNFGTRTGGICDTWLWTEDWKNLPEKEKWQYIALCTLYWWKKNKYYREHDEYLIFLDWLKENNMMDEYNKLIE